MREWMAAPDGPRAIDVRTSAAFPTAHIPGSYNVPRHLLSCRRAVTEPDLDDVLRELIAA
ncbi:MAG: rhodanese-like domain-containing protein [Actinomycetota bacterium]|nr:rhodanese-like domain-containing protein [Actinomycetota bacterium]